MMTQKPADDHVHIGFHSYVAAARIVAIITPQGSAMKRMRDDAYARGKLLDACKGRRVRSMIVTDSDHLILSMVAVEALLGRLRAGAKGDPHHG